MEYPFRLSIWDCSTQHQWFLSCEPNQIVNSLDPGRLSYSQSLIFEHMLWVKFRVKFMSISSEIALRWMPSNTSHDKSRMARVTAWCHQATSHYLNPYLLLNQYFNTIFHLKYHKFENVFIPIRIAVTECHDNRHHFDNWWEGLWL